MKSVSDGPVTNHFSPLRTYSPVAASRTAVAGQRPGVRALAGLRDRVAAVPLAAQARVQVAAPLLGRAVQQRVVAAGDEAPQAARDLTQLLVDEDLLQRGPALAPGGRAAGCRRGGRASMARRLISRMRLGGERAAVALELGLERLEHVDDVGAGPLAELGLRGGEGQVHGAQCGGTNLAPAGRSQDAGREAHRSLGGMSGRCPVSVAERRRGVRTIGTRACLATRSDRPAPQCLPGQGSCCSSVRSSR